MNFYSAKLMLSNPNAQIIEGVRIGFLMPVLQVKVTYKKHKQMIINFLTQFFNIKKWFKDILRTSHTYNHVLFRD